MDQNLIQKAQKFATEKHGNQTRKFSKELYINHPIQVSERVKEFTNDEENIAAALLHDVIEDTNTTRDELAENFPPNVVSIVKELTLDKARYEVLDKAPDGHHLTKFEKNEQKMKLKVPYIIEVFSNMSSSARLIKLADRENNVKHLEQADSIFASRYARETNQILKGLNSIFTSNEYLLVHSIQKYISKFLP